jgi:GMP synthase (glutamine-hydrolysing)
LRSGRHATTVLIMPILVIEHDSADTPGILGRVLGRHGLRFRTIRLHAGEQLPPDLDDVDGIISLGGPQSATDDALPWLAGEMRLLQGAAARSIPILGVCLGAQILARALGGTVGRMSAPSAGLGRVDLTPAGREDPLFRGLAWYGAWPGSHQDEVTQLPPDARILARSEACAVEAFACGMFSYGVQFHPEWSASAFVSRCESGGLLGDGDRAALAATIRDQAEPIERQAERFAENVASFLLPIERVNAGVAKDIHH